MATANDTSRRPIPGLDDLLTGGVLQEGNLSLMTFKNPERAQQAAFNHRYPIPRGIAAIGDLLWAAAQDENNQLEATTIGDIGCLLKHLAEVDETMHTIEVNAAFENGEARGRADSEFVEIPVVGRAS